MKRIAGGLILFVIVALVAAAACWTTARYMNRRTLDEGTDAHAWIHSQLGITEEQEKMLTPIEARFAEQKKHYVEMLRIANAELAQVILKDRSDSEHVKTAVERIHHAQGELQNATLQHIFEMKTVLTPEQYEKLLNLTADALSNAEHGR